MKRLIPLIAILVLVVLAASIVLAQAGVFEVPWHGIAGGSGRSESGDFSLTGTMGQAQAGEMSGGDYVVSSGFLSGYTVLLEDGDNTMYVPFISN